VKDDSRDFSSIREVALLLYLLSRLDKFFKLLCKSTVKILKGKLLHTSSNPLLHGPSLVVSDTIVD